MSITYIQSGRAALSLLFSKPFTLSILFCIIILRAISYWDFQPLTCQISLRPRKGPLSISFFSDYDIICSAVTIGHFEPHSRDPSNYPPFRLGKCNFLQSFGACLRSRLFALFAFNFFLILLIFLFFLFFACVSFLRLSLILYVVPSCF